MLASKNIYFNTISPLTLSARATVLTTAIKAGCDSFVMRPLNLATSFGMVMPSGGITALTSSAVGSLDGGGLLGRLAVGEPALDPF